MIVFFFFLAFVDIVVNKSTKFYKLNIHNLPWFFNLFLILNYIYNYALICFQQVVNILCQRPPEFYNSNER